MSAISTASGENQFQVRIYLFKPDNGVWVPLARKYRRQSQFTIVLTLEYPTYETELGIKSRRMRWLEQQRTFFTDMDGMEEDRVRHCLVEWNLQELFPTYVNPLQRQNGALLDSSLNEWKRLPPLVRKAIVLTITESIGSY